MTFGSNVGVSPEVLLILIISNSYSNKKEKIKYREKLGGQVKTMYRQEKLVRNCGRPMKYQVNVMEFHHLIRSGHECKIMKNR